MVYWGVHLGCWNSQLRNFHGNLSAEAVINLVGEVQTGDLQAVVYDFEVSKWTCLYSCTTTDNYMHIHNNYLESQDVCE